MSGRQAGDPPRDGLPLPVVVGGLLSSLSRVAPRHCLRHRAGGSERCGGRGRPRPRGRSELVPLALHAAARLLPVARGARLPPRPTRRLRQRLPQHVGHDATRNASLPARDWRPLRRLHRAARQGAEPRQRADHHPLAVLRAQGGHSPLARRGRLAARRGRRRSLRPHPPPHALRRAVGATSGATHARGRRHLHPPALLY